MANDGEVVVKVDGKFVEQMEALARGETPSDVSQGDGLKTPRAAGEKEAAPVVSTLRESIEALHDRAARIFRDEIDDEWEQLEDGTLSTEEPTVALLYRLDNRSWQAAIVYDGGMGTVPLLAGNSADSPEAAVAALAAEIEADECAATDEADG